MEALGTVGVQVANYYFSSLVHLLSKKQGALFNIGQYLTASKMVEILVNFFSKG